MIGEQIQHLDPAEDEEVPSMNLDDASEVEWEEGVETLKHLSFDELWAILGCPDKKLPHFNIIYDKTGLHNPWEHQDWFQENTNSEDIGCLEPRWHQLVGIVRMLQQAFRGESTLLMDDVGIGKTFQVAGVIVMLAFFRDFYTEHKQYPGAFGE